MRVVLASCSAVKARAVERAMLSIAPCCHITCKPVPSGVSRQPRGIAEMQSGAETRLEAAYEQDALIVSVENGIVGDYDLAVVVVQCPNGRRGLALSAGVHIPGDVMGRLTGDKTVGEAVAEVTACDEADPHSVLTAAHSSREELLAQAIVLAYAQTDSLFSRAP
jgi:non-canonical (house-cleaning) NTP pyrophosphatase